MALDCTAKIAARKQDPCDLTREGARVVAIAFLAKGLWVTVAPDGAAASTITTNLLTEEQSGNAYIVRRTSGSLAETQVTIAGRGMQKEESTVLDHALSIVDHEPVRNVEFWDNIKDTQNDWDLLVFTQSRGWRDLNRSLNIGSAMDIQDNLDEYVKINGTVNWTGKEHMKPFLYTEQTLNAPTTAGDVVLTEGGAGIIGGTSPAFTYSVVTAGNVDIAATLSSGAEVLSLQLLEGETLPAGITIAGTSLQGTAGAIGVETFSICVINIYGLETVVSVEYTVTA